MGASVAVEDLCLLWTYQPISRGLEPCILLRDHGGKCDPGAPLSNAQEEALMKLWHGTSPEEVTEFLEDREFCQKLPVDTRLSLIETLGVIQKDHERET